MINFTINNQPVTAQKGETILQAARKAGFYIPTMCYIEKTTPCASCRLCVVETNVTDDLRRCFIEAYTQCQEDTERVVCQNCEFVITTNDINKHLFIKVKGGGLIHWNCDDCKKLNKQD